MLERDIKSILKILKITREIDIEKLINELQDVVKMLDKSMYYRSGDEIDIPIIPNLRIIKE